jgi:hypothetical protein
MKEFYCNICKQQKDIDGFYKCNVTIGDIPFESVPFLKGCKTCIDINQIEWKIKLSLPKISSKNLEFCHTNHQLKEYSKKLNCQLEDLMLVSKAAKFLNIAPSGIERYIHFRVLKPIKIYPFPQCPAQFSYYLIKQDLESLKLKRISGEFFTKHNNQLPIPENTNYVFIHDKKPSQLLIYVDYSKSELPCPKCLTKRPRTEFADSSNKRGVYRYCNRCMTRDSRVRYKNLDPVKKRKLLQLHCECTKKYRKANRAKVNESRRIYMKNNPQARIKHHLRQRVAQYIKKLNISKTFSVSALLGCSTLELKTYLENKFQPGMNWDNHGPGFKLNDQNLPILDSTGNIIEEKQWHVDHIQPLSSFDLTDPTQRSIAAHYTNLQPLWAKQNLAKGANLNWNVDTHEITL